MFLFLPVYLESSLDNSLRFLKGLNFMYSRRSEAKVQSVSQPQIRWRIKTSPAVSTVHVHIFNTICSFNSEKNWNDREWLNLLNCVVTSSLVMKFYFLFPYCHSSPFSRLRALTSCRSCNQSVTINAKQRKNFTAFYKIYLHSNLKVLNRQKVLL